MSAPTDPAAVVLDPAQTKATGLVDSVLSVVKSILTFLGCILTAVVSLPGIIPIPAGWRGAAAVGSAAVAAGLVWLVKNRSLIDADMQRAVTAVEKIIGLVHPSVPVPAVVEVPVPMPQLPEQYHPEPQTVPAAADAVVTQEPSAADAAEVVAVDTADPTGYVDVNYGAPEPQTLA